jgi:3-phenylpropionate/trans-cinnamate dioxygenase ferredoxin reductase subunit
MTSQERVVIVGAGHAGFQAAASLREGGFAGDVVLIGDEPGLPYERPPLSKDFLAGKSDDLDFRPAAFFESHEIALLAGEPVVELCRAQNEVRLRAGQRVAYDHVVLATGARPRQLPVPGVDLEGVFGLRSRADAIALRERLPAVTRAVVIGAGFIGLEFAAVAAACGVAVVVVEAAGRAMGRAVTEDISRHFAGRHRSQGVDLRLECGIVALEGAGGHVSGARLADGSFLPAELVVVGVGVAPNSDLAEGAGLEVADGIVVDEHLRTSDPSISAVGDCANFPLAAPYAGLGTGAGRSRARLESVQNAIDQAKTVAARLCGSALQPYASVPWFWSYQGSGLRLQIAGLSAGHDEIVRTGDPTSGKFSVLCFASGRLLAVESVNSPADHAAARRLLARGADLTPAQAADASFSLKAHAAAFSTRVGSS